MKDKKKPDKKPIDDFDDEENDEERTAVIIGDVQIISRTNDIELVKNMALNVLQNKAVKSYLKNFNQNKFMNTLAKNSYVG